MWYDSCEGITKSLNSLGAFKKLINERHIAGYKRRERLYNWCVLGYYYLDSCGNVGTAIKFDAQEKIENFPDVVTIHDFNELIHNWEKKTKPDVLSQEELQADDFDYSKNTRPYPISISFGMKDIVPDTRIVCPFCKESWKMSNVKDVVERPVDAVLSLEPFADNLTIEKLLAFFKLQSYYINTYEFHDVEKSVLVKEKFKSIDVRKTYYYHKDCLIKSTEEKCRQFREVQGDNYTQSNLAGCIECDPFIQLELDLAGIPVAIVPKGNTEVPYTKTGLLKVNGKTFEFRRAWYYWMVSGDVPLNVAEKLYETELGKKVVRVAGHCGCPPPKDWIDENGNVTSYHIDSWQGLKFFVDTLQAYL